MTPRARLLLNYYMLSGVKIPPGIKIPLTKYEAELHRKLDRIAFLAMNPRGENGHN